MSRIEGLLVILRLGHPNDKELKNVTFSFQVVVVVLVSNLSNSEE